MRGHEHPGGNKPSILQFGWWAKICGTVLLAFTFTLCGCLSKPPLNEQTFAFNAPVTPAANGAAGGPVLGIKSLQIMPPFDGRLFVYRTGEFRYERDPYAGFLGLPAEQLAGPVSEILRGEGCFSDVLEAGRGMQPDTMVEISITQLYGDIRQPKAPFAVLGMQVTFQEATNGLPGKVILRQHYLRRVPMKTTGPAGLMAGWDRALVGILAEVASDFRSHAIKEQCRRGHDGNLSQN